jgi:two-component system, chemotaxis family, chemotaxis protein CheY
VTLCRHGSVGVADVGRQPTQLVRVLIIDDSDSMRLLVRLSLEMDASFEVVGEAANGLDGLRKSEELDPDLVVMDLSMPVMDGIEATRRIKQIRPEVGIVAFSAAGEEAIVDKVLAAGAYARVDKEDLIGLLHALQELAERVPVGAATARARPTALDVWTRTREGLAAAFASFGSFARSLGGAQVAGALGIGGAAALATVMLLITVSPGGDDPSNVIRPEVVLVPQTVAPQVGSIELDGDVEVAKQRDRGEGQDVDAAPVVTVEVASVEPAPTNAVPETPGGSGDGPNNGPGNSGGEGPGNGGNDNQGGQPHNGGPHGPPGNGPDNDPPGQGSPPDNGPSDNGPAGDGPADHGPPVAAKPNGKVPPGLAKKPGSMPPGQAKKSHPGKGRGKH